MKKMVLILSIILFIAYSSCVGSAEQILKENNIHEDSQITFAQNGAVEGGPAKNSTGSRQRSGLGSRLIHFWIFI